MSAEALLKEATKIAVWEKMEDGEEEEMKTKHKAMGARGKGPEMEGKHVIAKDRVSVKQGDACTSVGCVHGSLKHEDRRWPEQKSSARVLKENTGFARCAQPTNHSSLDAARISSSDETKKS